MSIPAIKETTEVHANSATLKEERYSGRDRLIRHPKKRSGGKKGSGDELQPRGSPPAVGGEQVGKSVQTAASR